MYASVAQYKYEEDGNVRVHTRTEKENQLIKKKKKKKMMMMMMCASLSISAAAAAAVAVPCSCTRIKSSNAQSNPVHKYSVSSGFCNHGTYVRYTTRALAMAQFGEPRKLMAQVNIFKDRLWEVFPEPVKELPWKKAQMIVLQHLLFLGESTLKWSLLVLFILSSLSDIMFSISRNKELIVPFGLLVGCMISDFLKGVCRELFLNSKEGDPKWHILGISSFFVLVKVASAYVSLGGQIFLSHIGNGGLLQVLWSWKKMQEERERNRSSTPFNTWVSSNLKD